MWIFTANSLFSYIVLYHHGKVYCKVLCRENLSGDLLCPVEGQAVCGPVGFLDTMFHEPPAGAGAGADSGGGAGAY